MAKAKDKAESALVELDQRDIELMAQNERFNAALENMSQGLCMFDGEQRIIVCNERYASIYGLTPEQVKAGTTLRQIIEYRIANGLYAGENPDDYVRERLDWVNNGVREKKIHELKDGRAISITHQPMSGGGWVTTHEDVTEYKKAERSLEQQALSMALLNSISVAANQSDYIEEAFGYCIEQVCNFTGWEVGHAYLSAAEGSGRMEPSKCWHTSDDSLYGPFRERTEQTLPVSGTGLVGQVMERGKPYWTANLTIDPNFTRAEAAKSTGLKGGVAFPVKVRDEVVAVLEFFSTLQMEPSAQLIDILTHVAAQIGQVVERERSKLKLTCQNERFNAALSNMSQGLCMFDGEQRLIECNELYTSMYDLPSKLGKPGTTLRQILEHRIANSIFGETDPDEYIKERIAWVTNRSRSTKIQQLNNGRSIQITHQPMPEGGWLDTHEDVTDLAQAQQVVQRQKEELDQILRNVPRAVVTSDSSGIIKTFNPAAQQTFGYTAAEAIGRNVSLLMPDEDKKHHDGYMRSYVETGVSKFIEVGPRRLTGCRKDGTGFPMELALAAIGRGKDRGFIGIAKDITEELETETRLVEHRDNLQTEVDLATAELKVQAEELKEALSKEQELNKLQREFVSMASHEFRTPLAIIDATAQRLKSKADKNQLTPEDAVQRVEKIRSAVQRMTRLMESTLDAARLEEGKIKVEIVECDLRYVVLQVLMTQIELSPGHNIICELEELPDAIQGDSGALIQIFTNLLSNAVKYAPDAPDIEVKGRTEGDQVVISVRDHGMGIDEDELSRIGERFFRARTSIGTAGTGIGLNLAKTLTEMHGGSFKVESKKGEGSTFTVRLPIAGPDHSEQVEPKVA